MRILVHCSNEELYKQNEALFNLNIKLLAAQDFWVFQRIKAFFPKIVMLHVFDVQMAWAVLAFLFFRTIYWCRYLPPRLPQQLVWVQADSWENYSSFTRKPELTILDKMRKALRSTFIILLQSIRKLKAPENGAILHVSAYNTSNWICQII